jgi:hypothetical protein
MVAPVFLRTPLCPAGHLPRKGGDRPAVSVSPIAKVAEEAVSTKLPISPLAGEMSGRTEGGAKERLHPHLHRTLNRVSRIATTIVSRAVATITSAM